MAIHWRKASLIGGVLVAGVAAGAIGMMSLRGGDGPYAGSPAPATRAMGAAPATTAFMKAVAGNCELAPMLPSAGNGDGHAVLQTNPSMASASEVGSLILEGKEAVASGHQRDAEIDFLNACRNAAALPDGDGIPLADAMYQLGRHYANVAAFGAPKSKELFQRAERLYSASLEAYRARYGEGHEKTRFAREGLTTVLQATGGKPPTAVAKAPPAAADSAPSVAPATTAAPAPAPAPAVAAATAPVPAPAPQVAKAPAPNPAPAPQVRVGPAPASVPQVAKAPVPAPAPQVMAKAPAPAPQIAKAEAPAPAPAPVPRVAAVPAPSAPAAQVSKAGPATPAPARPTPAPAREQVATAPAVNESAPQPRRTSPSFNCALARSTTEKLICGDEELARLDRDLGALHQRAKQAAPDRRAFQRNSDAEWQQREDTCRDRECLLRWYAQRRAELSTAAAAPRQADADARPAPATARSRVTEEPQPRVPTRRAPATSTTAEAEDEGRYLPPPSSRPRPLRVPAPGPEYQVPAPPPTMGMGAAGNGVPTAEGSAGTP
jgi:uncharacterized protein